MITNNLQKSSSCRFAPLPTEILKNLSYPKNPVESSLSINRSRGLHYLYRTSWFLRVCWYKNLQFLSKTFLAFLIFQNFSFHHSTSNPLSLKTKILTYIFCTVHIPLLPKAFFLKSPKIADIKCRVNEHFCRNQVDNCWVVSRIAKHKEILFKD